MEGVNGDTAFYLEGIDVPPVPEPISHPSKKLSNGVKDIPSPKVNGVNGINGHAKNGITA